jgi:hypothetical protein
MYGLTMRSNKHVTRYVEGFCVPCRSADTATNRQSCG